MIDAYEELYQAFGEVGEDADACDVEFAVEAQWEVISRDDLNGVKSAAWIRRTNADEGNFKQIPMATISAFGSACLPRGTSDVLLGSL